MRRITCPLCGQPLDVDEVVDVPSQTTTVVLLEPHENCVPDVPPEPVIPPED